MMPHWIDTDLKARKARGLYRTRRRLQSGQGVYVQLNGREFLNFTSNDYLNLASDPRLARAAAWAARKYGCGAGASPLVSGYLPPLRNLERALARWKGSESALVFSSGFVANLALISTLASGQDAIFSDELNHASLIDGCRLSRAKIHIYRHGDADHLHELLKSHGGGTRRRLIVTDSVFSMDGDLAPLNDLADLAARHDCLLLIDEAHATGVLGEKGCGAMAQRDEGDKVRGEKSGARDEGLEARGAGRDHFRHADSLPLASEYSRLTKPVAPIIKVGTLSKALGSQGGFVCGSRLFVNWLVNHSRPYIFSTALAPPAAAAARRAVRIVIDEPERRRHLLALAECLRDRLRSLGFPETRSCCQIVPVIVGDSRAAVGLSARLQEKGLLVPAIRPPSVPEGTARLRISLTAGHSEKDVQRLCDALQAS